MFRCLRSSSSHSLIVSGEKFAVKGQGIVVCGGCLGKEVATLIGLELPTTAFSARRVHYFLTEEFLVQVHYFIIPEIVVLQIDFKQIHIDLIIVDPILLVILSPFIFLNPYPFFLFLSLPLTLLPHLLLLTLLAFLQLLHVNDISGPRLFELPSGLFHQRFLHLLLPFLHVQDVVNFLIHPHMQPFLFESPQEPAIPHHFPHFMVRLRYQPTRLTLAFLFLNLLD